MDVFILAHALHKVIYLGIRGLEPGVDFLLHEKSV